jgi:hypothetical protein
MLVVLFYLQDEWKLPCNTLDSSLLKTIQVTMTVQQDKEADFILATQKHCEESMQYFSSNADTSSDIVAATHPPIRSVGCALV